MSVRPAIAADVAALAGLELDSFTDPWSPAWFETVIAGQVPTTQVLVLGEPPLGYVVVCLVFEIAEIQRIAVEPAQRRHGLASRLLAAAEQVCVQGGAERILLEVRESNTAAIAAYAAAGYVEIDRRARYYADGETALVMSRELVASAT